jgi:hypothetical protein
MFIFTSVIYQFSTKRVFGDPNIAEMLESMIEALKKEKQQSTKHTYETKDRATRAPLKTGGELKCSGREAVPAPLVTAVVLI